MTSPGVLYVLPCVINDTTNAYKHLPLGLKDHLESINFFVVENIRTARRFIKKVVPSKVIDQIQFHEIDKHQYHANYQSFLDHTLKGHDIALLSESGTASVGDPGFWVVNQAQQSNIRVIPVAGPSSIVQALSASGLNGQSFSFVGYLPILANEKISKLKSLEIVSKNSTQIFIEAPYRNNQLIETVLKVCNPETKLCIASDISGEKELILTKKIADWRKVKMPDCHKIPTIFLLGQSLAPLKGLMTS